FRRMDSWFLYVVDRGGVPYEVDENTLLYLDFNNEGAALVTDLSNYSWNIDFSSSLYSLPGVRGFARAGSEIGVKTKLIPLANKSFTVEGFFQALPPFSSSARLFEITSSTGDSL